MRSRGSIGTTRRLLLAIATMAVLACQPQGNASAPPDAWVTIRAQRVAVEIADTPEKQALGLGQRDALAIGHGMLFPYDRPSEHAFWMRGMRFSIDIVWIFKERIVKIDAHVPFEPGGNGPTLYSGSLVDAVLEVPAGYSVVHGWQVGDRVETLYANAES